MTLLSIFVKVVYFTSEIFAKSSCDNPSFSRYFFIFSLIIFIVIFQYVDSILVV